jgi:dTDP-glucose pyrophosphorylase
MKDWRRIVIKPEDTIIMALEVIDKGALQIALAVNETGQLVGAVTDGNIRRGILKGVGLDEPVKIIMNPKPVYISDKASYQQVLALMRQTKLRHIPTVDDQGILNGLHTLEELLVQDKKDNVVVLMAGGLGTRLHPLTISCPKPLLYIGDKPILERILESFVEQGFHKFIISINYRGEMIENHFGNGSDWTVSIEYLREQTRLGTAGALSLIKQEIDKPIIVMNGDILTKLDFGKLLQFHEETQAVATMCVREYTTEIPYGVVEITNNSLTNIVEKPVSKCFTNAGIYVLNPEILSYIPENSYYDMPDLFTSLIARNEKTAAFLIHDYWIDIGRMDDYERAIHEYMEVIK